MIDTQVSMNDQYKPTKRKFLKWRSPVRGKRNPQVMDNPFWQWCVRNPESAYQVNQNFNGPDSMSSGPCWCFARMGQTETKLADGRTVYIAGEHEDFYDPDFYIYSDVVIVDDTKVQIFGYPETEFPPTDFHTATLVGTKIVLVGNLGYQDKRVPGTTQVLQLDTKTWQMSAVETTGEMPGWIHKHSAYFNSDENTIVVSGGLRFGDRILENFDDYKLSLEDFTWTQLTDRKWSRWILEREDGETNRLWEIRNSSMMDQMGVSMEETMEKTFAESGLPPEIISEMSVSASNDEKAQIKTLYQSPFSDAIALEDDEEFGRYRLDVNGTTVRFDETHYHVTVTVEGNLPDDVESALITNLQNRLSSIEGSPYIVTRVQE